MTIPAQHFLLAHDGRTRTRIRTWTCLIRHVVPQQASHPDHRVLHDDPTLDPTFPIDDPQQPLKRPRESYDLLQVRVALRQLREEQERLVSQHLARSARHGRFSGIRVVGLRGCGRESGVEDGEEGVYARGRRTEDVCLDRMGVVDEQEGEELERVEPGVKGWRGGEDGE